ncbi:hypothetical protein B0A49_03297 [Cryomyces minteri]|uniref:CCZ1/INTU/HSP4 first Longin domain-containing protein n=1 Tax=Cryomyces minteri TaxID=331657 RepID=A0A4U0XFU2_9PEZI|nr:hypothetical protein B0A49_03297 [Cryomyces minteri]
MHGNPAADIFGGLKLAAGGELGFGVGEEDWGSGEREVLEDVTGRTEGLVDIVVSRFGELPEQQAADVKSTVSKNPSSLHDAENELWMGNGRHPGAADGVIFSGVGNISRSSLRDLSDWMALIYTQGDHAYGVADNPNRDRRKRRRRSPPDTCQAPPNTRTDSETTMKGDVNYRPPPNAKVNTNAKEADGGAERGTGQLTRRAKDPTNSPATSHPDIPAPIVSAAEKCLNTAISSADAAQRIETYDTVGSKSSYVDPEVWAKYLTLGAYGSSWMGWGKKEPRERPSAFRQESNDSAKAVKPEDRGSPPIEPSMKHIEPQPEGASEEAKLAQQRHLETSGHFVIGLKGDLTLENSDEDMDTYSSGGCFESGGSRTLLRTLYVETADGRRTNYEEDDGERGAISRETLTPSDSVSSGPKYQRMRVLVYVHRPFIYTLLFEQRTPSLSMSSFYHNLRHHFTPLHKALCSSTSPSKVAHRIADARTSPPQPESINPKDTPYNSPKTSPIFDLVFDSRTLTVHTSIPNIPEPGTSAAEGITTTSTGKDTPPPWTRLEALNVHVQILNTLASTRRATHDLERTCKTSRGWWVVWMRLPPSAQGEDAREAFLVRKASDYIAPVGKTSRVSSGMFGLGGRTEQARFGGRGPGSLADGIGIDARRYVEGLLSLNR